MIFEFQRNGRICRADVARGDCEQECPVDFRHRRGIIRIPDVIEKPIILRITFDEFRFSQYDPRVFDDAFVVRLQTKLGADWQSWTQCETEAIIITPHIDLSWTLEAVCHGQYTKTPAKWRNRLEYRYYRQS